MSEIITAEEYTSRLRVWCDKGRSYDQLPRKWRDRWILYHSICRGIGPDEILSESEVNDRLRSWLAGTGTPLGKIDVALIRRELIEKGFLERDPAGREYRRSPRHEKRYTFHPEIAALDPAEILQAGVARKDGA